MRMLHTGTGELVTISFDPVERQKKRLVRLKVAVWVAVTQMAEWSRDGRCRLVMLTLTYRRRKDWAPRHINDAVRWCRKHGSIGTVWVCELQKRGAPHYHLLTCWPLSDRWIKPTEENGGWAKGFTWVTDNIKHPWYIMKYIQKGQGDERRNCYPKGLRIFAVSRSITRALVGEQRLAYRRLQLPYWYTQGAKDDSAILGAKRIVGGVDCSGTTIASPYRVYHLGGVAENTVKEYDDCYNDW